ncbi:hypothetical protein ACH5RR_039095 [Cinchona calisaya]|uniref:Cytosine-specific methyltransferase n=1 Tax=Cinchona calisaya TaxID=153742 RepID=A0ABD2Y0N8_9GENT
MPKQAAAGFDFNEKPPQMSKRSGVIEMKKDQSVEEEAVAIRLTAGQENGRPCRRLVDYIFHNSDGIPQPFEMLEVDDVFISGHILPLEESVDKEKAKGIRCEGFGRMEEWAISGYEDGSPVIWVSTDIADYDCLKPSGGYKKHYDQFFAKASASVEVYKKLTKSSGGNPNLTLDELLAGVVDAMSGMKCFSGVACISDFVIFQGEFIYNQLIGLDETSKKTDQLFVELPVLAALRDKCTCKLANLAQSKAGSSAGSSNLGSEELDGNTMNYQSGSSSCPLEDDEDLKLARILCEQKYWRSVKPKKGIKTKKNIPGPASNKKASNVEKKEKKRSSSQITKEPTSRKMPKTAAACLDFKEKCLQISKNSDVIEMIKDQSLKEEAVAILLTAGQEDGRPCRRLVDYVFHNSDGIPQPLEMLEIDDVFISGLILPLEESIDKEKAKGVRCEGFGRVEEWAISGYEEGSPVIWVSTDIADYDCLKPSGGYKKQYNQFFAKASASVAVYKKLSKSSCGNPDLTLDELLTGVVQAMSGMEFLAGVASIREFVISQGEFIYSQLVGLDETSKKTDQLFLELPVLAALRDECTSNLENLAQTKAGSLNIGPEERDGNMNHHSGSLSCPLEEDDDLKFARLLHDDVHWHSMKEKKIQDVKKKKNKTGSATKMKAFNVQKREKKRSRSRITEEPTSQKKPKQAASCFDFKEKPLQISKKSDVIDIKKDQSVKEEAVAIRLTSGEEYGRPCRRLVDYIFHDSDGIPQPFEMLEVDDVFISGLILPLEESVDKEKAKGVRCEGFGRIEEWAISGYEDGSPVIWVSTDIADYDCLKPSGGYKKHYDLFFAKASASFEVYKKLSKSSGGNPDLTLDELLAVLVSAMSCMKCFSGVASIREFVISQGEFIYYQLIGLDETSKETDQSFLELPVLVALRDECRKLANVAQMSDDYCGDFGSTFGVKKMINKPGPAFKKRASNFKEKEEKRYGSQIAEESTSRKIPNRAASGWDFKEKPLQMSKKLDVIEMKKDKCVEEEAVAIMLTAGREDGRPCRRLVDYIFHNSDGIPQPFEMLEVDNIFISGLILPLEESVDKEKGEGVRCEGFGRVEEWAISGYEEGSPVIWVSTDIADYDCLKPSVGYKKHYDQFFAKASASVVVYRKLSKSCGGNPNLTRDELLAGVVRAMSGMKCFSGVASIREFVISQGEFIYNQLIGLDETSNKTDQSFLELPVLAALRDECRKLANVAQMSDDYCGDFGSTFGVKKKINKPGPAFKKRASNLNEKEEKRYCSQIAEESTSRKIPNRAAAGWDFKEKPLQMSKKLDVIEMKKDKCVEEEAVAITLTAGQEDGRPCRRLVDYIFHNSDGIPQPFEMLEVDNIFISGLILPLEESVDKEKVEGVRCEGFGRVEEWAISGYEEGSPVIWVSTDIADYDCLKPSVGYKKHYDQFFAKASASVVVYRKLSKSCGGNPSLTLDELLAGVVRAMSGMKCFSGVASIRESVISQGEFIYNQLIGLDETSNKTDQSFLELPVLAALRDECCRLSNLAETKDGSLAGSLKVGSKEIDGNNMNHQSGSLDCPLEEDKDVKLARLLHEEKYWRSMKPKKSLGSSSLSSKYCITVNEEEIANDYPCPVHYSTSNPETDEYLLFDRGDDICYMDDLPRSMLHNWALYNIDLRMISLELLPMKPCAEIDVTIYGSGVMTSDDGFGYHLETDPDQSSSSGSGISEIDGIPIYLSAIKEWTIEFKSSMFFVSIRTDMAWYRLGKPLKQYAPWYGPVLKTARLAISIITLLKVQTRVARLSFADVIKRVSNFEKDHPAYISSKADVVERYVVVHGQIILQQFSEFPDDNIKQCAFVDGLTQKMEERHQTKWLVKKKKVVQRNKSNLNPRAGMSPIFSKRKAMQATTTRLINRIWGEYYSNYSPEELNDGNISNMKGDINEDEDVEELEENEEDNVLEERKVLPEKPQTPFSSSRRTQSFSTSKEVKWIGESVGKNYSSKTLYKSAIVHDNEIAVGGVVLVENDESDEVMYFVEYMYEKSDRSKMFHGCLMERGSQTVLGNAANEREVFLTNECMDFKLEDAKQIVAVQIRTRPWGHQHRKENAIADKTDRIRAQERKTKGLPPEYYCKSLYSPEKGAFFSLPINEMGLGSGLCHSCKLKEIDSDKENFEINASLTSFVYLGTQYSVYDYIYVNFHQFSAKKVEREIYRAGRNVGLKAYVVCQVLKIMTSNATRKAEPDSTQVKIRRFFRPEDISEEMVYCSDIREIYYSEETHTIAVDAIEGKCEVRNKHDLPSEEVPAIFDHVFFCERQYDSSKGSLKQMPSHIKLRYSPTKLSNDHDYMKKRGKCKGENDLGVEKLKLAFQENCLATLDIFSGCGGLSEGLQQSGVSITKWAIEYEEAAGDAFKLNHPASLVLINNCNVILRAVMQKCGDADDCLSTPEAADLAASLDQEEVDNLPLPGQVDFINGGPPCQGFSGMNRFNHSTWSKVQCEMILAFLSFADYYRPKYFLLENVRNFVSFNQGQTFRLTLASLLEIGYQVRFGILEAGAYGLPQSRKRAFIWAASPDEVLPDWPEPMHVFATPELKITLSGNSQYVAVRSTANGAPFRPSTVRDTIGDLPAVVNGSSKTIMEYRRDPLSWFQKRIRGNSVVLTDHITKEMNELNFIRCQRIPKRPGADWRNFPNEKVKLSTGQVVDLIPWCLTNTAKRHNQWKGLFGRLDWEGNFPISVTDPQPMGKVGLCFHPEQDRIVTVRECARSQGFQDSYKFSGNILQKHRQIGNAVPPPLAYALGRKLKEAINSKRSAC